jgi:hypothetical protein
MALHCMLRGYSFTFLYVDDFRTSQDSPISLHRQLRDKLLFIYRICSYLTRNICGPPRPVTGMACNILEETNLLTTAVRTKPHSRFLKMSDYCRIRYFAAVHFLEENLGNHTLLICFMGIDPRVPAGDSTNQFYVCVRSHSV